MRQRIAGLLLLAASAGAAAAQEPAAFRLALPVACSFGTKCWLQQYVDRDPSSGVRDYACGSQSYDGHDGTDIRIATAASRVDVIASAPGIVRATRDGMTDRLALTPEAKAGLRGVECGNGVIIDHEGGWQTQYCHMRQGSITVKKGDRVDTGSKLGEVGFSGFVEFPHLHLTVRHDGKTVDPFRPEGGSASACGVKDPLWTAQAMQALSYHEGEFIHVGFAPGPVSLRDIQERELPSSAANSDWPALVAYGWLINLEADDRLEIWIEGPAGFESKNGETLDRAKAQYMIFAGRKSPARGFKPGLYTAAMTVTRKGSLALQRTWQAEIK